MNGESKTILRMDESPVTATDPKEPQYTDSFLPKSACRILIETVGREFKQTSISKMVQINHPFAVGSDRGMIEGAPGDWLSTDDGNNFYIVTKAEHDKQYRPSRRRNRKTKKIQPQSDGQTQ